MTSVLPLTLALGLFTGGITQYTSPTWPKSEISRIDLEVSCPTEKPACHVRLAFLHNGAEVGEPFEFSRVFTANQPEALTVTAAANLHANGFSLTPVGTGNDIWQIRSITLSYTGSLEIPSESGKGLIFSLN